MIFARHGEQTGRIHRTGFKDRVEKAYFRDPEHVADLVNGTIFSGRQAVRTEDIAVADPDEVAADIVNNKAVSKEAYRDGLSCVTVNTDKGRFVLFLIARENQTHVHYAIPVKAMVGDALNFAGQVTRISRDHRKRDKGSEEKIPADEFLSGFRKGDNLLPVITIVIYWNAGPWDGPRRLKEMYDQDILPEEILAWAPDYPAYVLVPEEADLNNFHTSLRYLLGACRAMNNKEELKKLLTEDPAYQSLDRDAALVLRAVTEMKFKIPKKEEKINMSKAVEEWTKELLAEGSARGEAIGEARGEVKGVAKGEVKGNLNSIFKFTEDGTLPLARAVNEAMSYGVKNEKDFRKKAKKFGYKIS